MKLKYKSSIKKDSRPGPVSGHSDTIGRKYSTKKNFISLGIHGPDRRQFGFELHYFHNSRF